MAEKKANLSLKDLYSDQPLFTKVVALFDQGQTYDYIQEFLEAQNKPMSRGTLANLKKKLKEAQETNTPIGDIVDQRNKNNISQIKNKVSGYTGEIKQADEVSPEITRLAENKWWSTEEILDKIIAKGLKTIEYSDVLDTPMLLKAIDMKEKYHGNDNGGLSLQAIKQWQILSQAQMQAVQQVLLEYIPEEQQDEVLDEMTKAADQVIQNMEVSPDGKQLINALRKEGLDL